MFICRIVPVLVVLSWSVGLAQAEWKEFTASTNSGGYTLYIDTTNLGIDKKSGLVNMWMLYDFKTAQIDDQMPYFSARTQRQYDCKQGRARTLTQSFFDGNMATGQLVSAKFTESTWEPVAPGTIAASLWNFACGNAKR